MSSIDPNIHGGFYRHVCRFCRKEFFSGRRKDYECCYEHEKLYKERKQIEKRMKQHD